MKPCAHASYCPLRMRDGDRPGCINWLERRDCKPSVQVETFKLHELFFAGPRNRLTGSKI